MQKYFAEKLNRSEKGRFRVTEKHVFGAKDQTSASCWGHTDYIYGKLKRTKKHLDQQAEPPVRGRQLRLLVRWPFPPTHRHLENNTSEQLPRSCPSAPTSNPPSSIYTRQPTSTYHPPPWMLMHTPEHITAELQCSIMWTHLNSMELNEDASVLHWLEISVGWKQGFIHIWKQRSHSEQEVNAEPLNHTHSHTHLGAQQQWGFFLFCLLIYNPPNQVKSNSGEETADSWL